MSRLTEAFRRANEGVAAAPVDTHESLDTFPVEADRAEPVRSAVPIAPVDDEPLPYAGEQTLTRRPDSMGRRVTADSSGRSIQVDPADGRVQEQKPPPAHGPDGQLSVFTEFNKKLVERLVVPNGAPHTMIEEYRKLAAALHHAQLAHGTRVIMVTSASPGEGKTLTASNLALTLSQSYQRHVLLIDADLRKPSVHDVFGVENAAGLIDALRQSPEKTERHVPLVQVSTRLELLL